MGNAKAAAFTCLAHIDFPIGWKSAVTSNDLVVGCRNNGSLTEANFVDDSGFRDPARQNFQMPAVQGQRLPRNQRSQNWFRSAFHAGKPSFIARSANDLEFERVKRPLMDSMILRHFFVKLFRICPPIRGLSACVSRPIPMWEKFPEPI